MNYSIIFTEICFSPLTLIVKYYSLANLSQPQQLSTYALTLFKYKTKVNDQDIQVGMYNNWPSFQIVQGKTRDLLVDGNRCLLALYQLITISVCLSAFLRCCMSKLEKAL